MYLLSRSIAHAYCILLPCALLLSGCSSIAPSPTSTLQLPNNYSNTAASAPTTGPTNVVKIDQWWLAFNDPQLTRLINLTRKENFDVTTALSRVAQAQAGVKSLGGNLMPLISITGSESNNSSGLPDMIKQVNADTKAGRLAVEANWEIDIFGIGRAAKTAATKDVYTAFAGIEGAKLTATNETAKQYFYYQSFLEKQRVLQQILNTQQQTLATTEQKQKEGLASDFDLTRIKVDVYQTQSLLPAISTALEVTKNQLALLTATIPNKMAITPNAAILRAPLLLNDIPSGQPLALLSRRPDVKAAEFQLQAASARLGQAKANRLPRFFLNAVFGRQDLTLNALNLAPVAYKNLALAFSMPILDFGRVKAAEDAQQTKESEQLINYDRTLLTAFTQVENALAARRDEREKNNLLEKINSLRHQSRAHADMLFKEGQIDLLQLLDVQRGVLNSEINWIDSTTQQAINTINLLTALGGGWQQQSSSTSNSTTQQVSKP